MDYANMNYYESLVQDNEASSQAYQSQLDNYKTQYNDLLTLNETLSHDKGMGVLNGSAMLGGMFAHTTFAKNMMPDWFSSAENPQDMVVNALNKLAGKATGAVNDAVNGAVDTATDAVNGAINSATDAVNGAINSATDAVNGAVNGARSTANEAVNALSSGPSAGDETLGMELVDMNPVTTGISETNFSEAGATALNEGSLASRVAGTGFSEAQLGDAPAQLTQASAQNAIQGVDPEALDVAPTLADAGLADAGLGEATAGLGEATAGLGEATAGLVADTGVAISSVGATLGAEAGASLLTASALGPIGLAVLALGGVGYGLYELFDRKKDRPHEAPPAPPPTATTPVLQSGINN